MQPLHITAPQASAAQALRSETKHFHSPHPSSLAR